MACCFNNLSNKSRLQMPRPLFWWTGMQILQSILQWQFTILWLSASKQMSGEVKGTGEGHRTFKADLNYRRVQSFPRGTSILTCSLPSLWWRHNELGHMWPCLTWSVKLSSAHVYCRDQSEHWPNSLEKKDLTTSHVERRLPSFLFISCDRQLYSSLFGSQSAKSFPRPLTTFSIPGRWHFTWKSVSSSWSCVCDCMTLGCIRVSGRSYWEYVVVYFWVIVVHNEIEVSINTTQLH